MKRSISNFRLIIMLTLMLSFTVVASAQRGRQNNNHYGYNSNRHYSYNNHNNYHYAPVRINTSYRYRPNYYSRPVYRPRYYRPTYRLPHYVHYGPSFGFHLRILPVGYSTIYVGRSPYYYNDGIYYRPYANGGYEVAAPPLGAEVSRLPAGAKSTVIDGEKYYELGGTFYQEQVSSDNKLRYKVVGTDGVLNTGKYDQEEPAVNNDPVPNNDYVAPNVESNVVPNVTPNVESNVVPNVAPNAAPNVAPVVGSRVDKLPPGSKVVLVDQQKYYLSADGVYYQEVIEGNSVRYEVTGTQAN